MSKEGGKESMFSLLFPGQGSQKVGMGLDLYESTPVKDLYKKVDSILGRDLTQIFMHGPEEELNKTLNTQVAIVTISCVLSILLKERLKEKKLPEIEVVSCTGHSLGEFSALWYSGLMSFEELIKIVSIRGNLMHNAPSGGMAAILNLQAEKIIEILKKYNYEADIVIANYNSPNQIVISGKKDSILKIEPMLTEAGAKYISLPVSGAFHSPLMLESSNKFISEIDKMNLLIKDNIKIPIYQNCDGRSSTSSQEIIAKLKKQMTSPVYWTQIVNNIVTTGVTTFIEIGPGKILTGLVKKINKNLLCFNISDLESIENFIKIYESSLLKTNS